MLRKAIGLSLIGLTTALVSATAIAKPPTNDESLSACWGKQYYKFNAIQVHNKDSANCDNNGSRMFFSETGPNNSTIHFYPDPLATGFEVTDCDGTVDGSTAISYDDDGKIPEGTEVLIAAALHGPTTLSNFVCLRKYTDLTSDQCAIGTGTIGQKFFVKVNDNLWEEDLAEILWNWDGDWKVMDIRVYEDLCN